MPQLDTPSYLTQYVWVLLGLLILFFVAVLGVLPVLQQQGVLRIWAEEGFKSKRTGNLLNRANFPFLLISILS